MHRFPFGAHGTALVSVGDKPADIREKIQTLEDHMLTLPQVEMQVFHHFAPGLYARELHIPKGTVLTGAVHKTEHLNIVSKGSISVMTDDGMKRVEAPFTMTSKPGTKRIGFTHEDTVWTTIHANPNDIKDIPSLEDALTTRTHDEYLNHAETIKLLENEKCPLQ